MIGPFRHVRKLSIYTGYGISDYQYLIRENLTLTQRLSLEEQLSDSLNLCLHLVYEGWQYDNSNGIKRWKMRSEKAIRADIEQAFAKVEVLQKQIQAFKAGKRADVKLAG